MVQGGLSTVAVVGLGKIGLPLAVQYAQHGRCVIGCDIDSRIVEMVNAAQSHVQEEPELAAELPRLVREGLLSATVDTTEAVRLANVVVVIVPVVIDAQKKVNYRAIDAATTAVGAGLQPGTLVIYETTLPVGTTSRRLAHLLERSSGLILGQDFFLAYSPERVSSGHIFRDLRIYPKVIAGVDEQSTAAALSFYQSVLDARVITMASTDEAEFVKLIETTYRDVNIALANEFACFADAHGLDVAAAIAAANTQPYSHIHTPGVGVGGHCIPVYPYFLLAGVEDGRPQMQDAKWLGGGHMVAEASTMGNLKSPATQTQPPLAPTSPPYSMQKDDGDSKLPMLTLPLYARHINDAMAEYAVQRLQAVIGSLAHQSVLILGVTYRGDVREVAFTSAKLLQEALLAHGAVAYADDPLFSADELQALGYRPFTAELESKIGAIILQADHQAYRRFDFSRFSHCQAVLDGRRALQRTQIEALGIRYIAIGDGYDE